ncbi:MAG: InlB B-repeat-containing protein [Bacilli bacterium]|nr:InlB B-repeat-containing protein [Bacilli bacterium]
MKKKNYLFLAFLFFAISTLIVFIIDTNKANKMDDYKQKKENVKKQKKVNNIKNEDSTNDNTKEDRKGKPYKIELIKNSDEYSNSITNDEQILPVKQYPETYTVYFDYNGGVEGIKSKDVTYKNKYGSLPIPIKEGYTFDGWYTNLDYNEKTTNTSKVTIKGNHTLYAKFNINDYLITYDYNYMKDNLYKNTSEKSFWNLDNFTIMTNDETFNLENVYKFTFDKNSTNLKYNEELKLEDGKTYTYSLYIKSNKEKNLSIGFENDLTNINVNDSWQRYTKTFKANDYEYKSFEFNLNNDDNFDNEDTLLIYDFSISEGNLNAKTESKRYGDELGELEIPIRDGYTFDGWYTDFTFKENISNNTLVDSFDKTYYAKWIPKLYTLNINPNKGVYKGDSTSKTYTQSYDTMIKLINPKASYKITYDLNNTNASNNKNEDIIDRPFKGLYTDEGKLYPKDTFIFNKDLSLTAQYDDNIEATLDSISKKDYICSWNTKEDGTGEKYDSNGKININDNITLYAKCDKILKFEKPINSGCITSEYGNRIHPIYGYNKFHSGIDMSGSDKNIYPISDGVVAASDYNSSMGNYIIIYHVLNGQKYTSSYYHLENRYVKKNDNVTSDTLIGKMGKTGLATGVHLHLTMHKGYLYDGDSDIVNPRDYLDFPTGLYNYWYNR